MLTKLLLLMGAYAGSTKQLFIGENNKLKYFERWDVIGSNMRVMQAYLPLMKQKETAALAQGYDWSRMPKNTLAVFEARAKATIE